MTSTFDKSVLCVITGLHTKNVARGGEGQTETFQVVGGTKV